MFLSFANAALTRGTKLAGVGLMGRCEWGDLKLGVHVRVHDH
jgi:hypothetical protein